MGFLRATHWGLPLVMSGVAVGIYLLSRNDVRPYSWLAVLPIALAGCVSAALDMAPEKRMVAPFIICGAWMVAMGTWALVRYLQAHPKQDAGEEGRA